AFSFPVGLEKRLTMACAPCHSLRSTGTLVEYFLGDRQCREDIRPACVEGELRQYFCPLLLGQPIIHCSVEMIWDLRDLPGSNEGADGNQTTVARCKVRTQPQVEKQDIGRVLQDSGSYRTKLLFVPRCALCLGGFVERQELR